MAAPAPPPASSSTTTPRWPRSSEPSTSPFARSGRGGGSGPAGRGRGPPAARGPRGGARPADTKATDDKPSTTPAAAAAAAPASPAPAKSKPPQSRRHSRPVPPPVQTHIPTADVPPAPHSARPSNGRRRRNQPPKTPAHVPPSIHAPAPSDPLQRLGKPRLPSVPHTAPIKDTPPHLRAGSASAANSTPRHDIRNDIDALVERVRASAMDHLRPSTPGSHIDWAGDDDDSLPDLDDWGVTPSVFAGKSDAISPIIVDGLRPLPDLAPQSYHASPLQREVSPPPVVESHPGPSANPSESTPEPPPVEQKPAPPALTNINRKPLHPSLPAKPSAVLAVAPPKPVVVATPMRISPYNPNSSTHDTFAGRAPKSAGPDTPTPPVSVQAETTSCAVEVVEAKLVELVAEKVEEEVIVVVEETTTTTTTSEVAETETPSKEDTTPTPVVATTPALLSRDPLDDFTVAEGLRASIHAPRPSSANAALAASAPATVVSFADMRPLHSAPPHAAVQTHTHARAHTVGRTPNQNGGSGDRSPGVRGRGVYGGYGGAGSNGGGGAHLRNHSSPAAAGGSYRTAHTARPKLTGAALSLLTRTIGGGGGSPSKSQTVAMLGE